MGNRLEYQYPQVYAHLSSLEAGERVEAARAVAEEALRRVGQEMPDDAEALRQLVLTLDRAAWDVQEAVDRGEQPRSAYESAFASARAANALLYCLSGPEPYESVYEALATSSGPAWVLEVLRDR